jgi:hypothetical protein
MHSVLMRPEEFALLVNDLDLRQAYPANELTGGSDQAVLSQIRISY